MAALKAISGLSTKLLSRNRSLLYSVRCYGLLDKPDGYYEPANQPPKTREEIEKAAAKYHLHPDEYKPTEEHGDYPEVEHADQRDPYYPWDIPRRMKMYHETIHHESDHPAVYDYQYLYPPLRGALIFLVVCGTFGGILYLGRESSVKAMEKQYPSQDKVHYTFERKTSAA